MSGKNHTLTCAEMSTIDGGGDFVKRNRKSLIDTVKQTRMDKRTDVNEGKLSKRENSAEQNGEDF